MRIVENKLDHILFLCSVGILSGFITRPIQKTAIPEIILENIIFLNYSLTSLPS